MTLLTLTSNVVPANATNKTIVWTVKEQGTTGAAMQASHGGNVVAAQSAGTAVVTATITDGLAVGTPYTKDFTITFAAAETVVAVGTYEALTNALKNTPSSIRLTADITVEAPGITIGRDVTIYGDGYTLSVRTPGTDEWGKVQAGASDYKLLTVDSGTKLTLENMTLKGGKQTALVNNGTLRMDNVIITQSGSYTPDAPGGDGLGGGGLRNNERTTAVLTDCAFTRNVANYGGGFVNLGTMIMDRCSVTENRSMTHGGGGCENKGDFSTATLYLNNCTFANNQSKEIGGGINNFRATLYALNTTVVGNVSAYNGPESGGGIGNNGGTVKLVNSIVSNNYASASSGGAFEASDIGAYSGTNVTAYNSLIGSYIGGTLSGTDNDTDIANVFAGLRASELLNENGAPTATPPEGLGQRPILVKQGNGTYVAPLSTTAGHKGVTGGCDVYFTYDADKASVSAIGYGTVPTYLEGSGGTKVTKFQDGTTDRVAPNVVRGGMATGTAGQYYTVKVTSPTNCTVTGGSAYSDSYASGAKIDFTATPHSGYTFVGWYNGSTELSKAQSYTHTVTANITITAKVEDTAKVNAVAPTITNDLVTAEVTYTKNATAAALDATATATDHGTLSYAWYSNTTNSTANGTLLSEAGASYTPLTGTTGTTYYYCVVTNTNNSATGTRTASTTSSVAKITVNDKVNAAAPTITMNLSTDEVTYTQGATTVTALSVTATVTDSGTITYQWYSNSSNSTTGGAQKDGETNATYTPPTTATGTTYYYCIVTNTINNNNDGGTKTATATSNAAMITVTAQASTYTITFDANGGSGSPASAATDGVKLTTLPTPTKSGYRFDGWFTEASGGTKITTSTVFTGDTTVYAQWVSTPVPPPTPNIDYDYTPPMKPVIVDGKTQNIGSEKTYGGTTVINVDQPKLTEQLGKANDESSVVVPVSANATATVSLMLKNVEDMAKKNMTLSVKTGGITYDLPTASVGVAALAAAFPGQDTAKIPFEVTIKAADVKIDGATVIVTPVSFTVSAVYGGKSMTVDRFSAFVERTFEITKAQSEIISTAVVVESDGTLRHVPTFVFEKDGKYYATVKSMTNSVYALIQNEVTFADAVGKWYEDVANEVGSRRIVIGTDKGTFSGDAKITRAEYATMMVRALGLPLSKSDSFTDVAANAWYAGYVATACEHGIVNGIGNNMFNPKGLITRQEAMQMIYNASKLTGFPTLLNARNLSAEFGDFATVDKWATEAVSWCLNNNLSVNLKDMVNPTEEITRGEMSAMILRLLQRSELVDVRAKA